MRSFVVLGKQFCGFLLIENQILNCLIVELTNCRKNYKYYFIHIYHYAIDDEKNTYYFIFSPDFKKHIECEQLVLKKNIIPVIVKLLLHEHEVSIPVKTDIPLPLQRLL